MFASKIEKRNIVERKAIEVVEHNLNTLHGLDYEFEFQTNCKVKEFLKVSGSQVVFGYCDYRSRKIVLNTFILECSIDQICDTLLHEVAHAIAGELYDDYGHGRYWKKVARMLGCNDKAKAKISYEGEDKVVWDQVIKNSKYVMIHITKDNEIEFLAARNRRNRKIKSFKITGDTSNMSLGRIFYVNSEIYSTGNKEEIVANAFQ